MKGMKKSAKRLKPYTEEQAGTSPSGTKKKAKLNETEAAVTEAHPPEKRLRKKRKAPLADEIPSDKQNQPHARISSDLLATPMKRKAVDLDEGSLKKRQKVKFILKRNTVLRKL